MEEAISGSTENTLGALWGREWPVQPCRPPSWWGPQAPLCVDPAPGPGLASCFVSHFPPGSWACFLSSPLNAGHFPLHYLLRHVLKWGLTVAQTLPPPSLKPLPCLLSRAGRLRAGLSLCLAPQGCHRACTVFSATQNAPPQVPLASGHLPSSERPCPVWEMVNDSEPLPSA